MGGSTTPAQLRATLSGVATAATSPLDPAPAPRPKQPKKVRRTCGGLKEHKRECLNCHHRREEMGDAAGPACGQLYWECPHDLVEYAARVGARWLLGYCREIHSESVFDTIIFGRALKKEMRKDRTNIELLSELTQHQQQQKLQQQQVRGEGDGGKAAADRSSVAAHEKKETFRAKVMRGLEAAVRDADRARNADERATIDAKRVLREAQEQRTANERQWEERQRRGRVAEAERVWAEQLRKAREERRQSLSVVFPHTYHTFA